MKRGKKGIMKRKKDEGSEKKVKIYTICRILDTQMNKTEERAKNSETEREREREKSL